MNTTTQNCGFDKSHSDSEEKQLDFIVESLREIDEALETLRGQKKPSVS